MLYECIHLIKEDLDVVSWESELHLHFASELLPDDWYLIEHNTTEKVSHVTADSQTMHCRKFQHLPLPFDNRKLVTNLSNMLLKDTACPALGRGLNYVVALVAIPIEDMLSGVQKAIGALPEKAAEEVNMENCQDPSLGSEGL